jgi:hypothetical protein
MTARSSKRNLNLKQCSVRGGVARFRACHMARFGSDSKIGKVRNNAPPISKSITAMFPIGRPGPVGAPGHIPPQVSHFLALPHLLRRVTASRGSLFQAAASTVVRSLRLVTTVQDFKFRLRRPRPGAQENHESEPGRPPGGLMTGLCLSSSLNLA